MRQVKLRQTLELPHQTLETLRYLDDLALHEGDPYQPGQFPTLLCFR
jgi:hypothetical protein